MAGKKEAYSLFKNGVGGFLPLDVTSHYCATSAARVRGDAKHQNHTFKAMFVHLRGTWKVDYENEWGGLDSTRLGRFNLEQPETDSELQGSRLRLPVIAVGSMNEVFCAHSDIRGQQRSTNKPREGENALAGQTCADLVYLLSRRR